MLNLAKKDFYESGISIFCMIWHFSKTANSKNLFHHSTSSTLSSAIKPILKPISLSLSLLTQTHTLTHPFSDTHNFTTRVRKSHKIKRAIKSFNASVRLKFCSNAECCLIFLNCGKGQFFEVSCCVKRRARDRSRAVFT